MLDKSCIFATWIGRSSYRPTRASLSPFHVCIDRRYLKNRQIMEQEIWKNVVGYEGYYQVSNFGNVMRTSKEYVNSIGHLCKSNEKQCKLDIYKNGYVYVHLSIGGRAKHVQVHRLVAMAFIPNPNNLPQVNHKDGNKTNNSVDNLEWCTAGENERHAYRIGLKKPNMSQLGKVGESSARGIAIIQYDKNMNFVAEYPTARIAAKHIGVHPASVSKCANLKNKCKGYYFRWAKDTKTAF